METVLIIEDETTMLRGLKDNFTYKGYRVLTATDGEEGLTAALNERPDLIILDPASRFSTGDDNDNRIATRFIQYLESLRKAGGEDTTLLFTHHTRMDKGGSMADSIRGASALRDGVRWALLLQYDKYDKDDKLIDDDAKAKPATTTKPAIPIPVEVRGEIVCKVAKTNYTDGRYFDLKLERLEKNKGALTRYIKKNNGTS